MIAAPATPGRDIVVVGASAGGVEALTRLFAGLPPDLPAALFVVLHVPPGGTSLLPEILGRRGPMPVAHARHGEPIAPGRAYVAPPNHHLLVRPGRVHLSLGPRENRQRPAVDALFRSAARFYGRRTVGVVLSGSLDDGAAGLVTVKARGGATVVQDPADALFDSMPRSALAAVAADAVLPAAEIGAALARLAREPVAGEEPSGSRGLELEDRIAEADPAVLDGDEHPGQPVSLGCPECGGTLWELRDGDLIRYRCRVGHAFSAATLLEHQADALEEAFWVALRTLEERASLARRLTRNAADRGLHQAADRFREQEQEAVRRADVVRRVLLRANDERQTVDLPGADEPRARSSAAPGGRLASSD